MSKKYSKSRLSIPEFYPRHPLSPDQHFVARGLFRLKIQNFHLLCHKGSKAGYFWARSSLDFDTGQTLGSHSLEIAAPRCKFAAFPSQVQQTRLCHDKCEDFVGVTSLLGSVEAAWFCYITGEAHVSISKFGTSG